MFKQRTLDQINGRCDKLEAFGLKCLNLDSCVIHESFPDIEMDFSAIDLDSDKSARNIMWCVMQITSSVYYEQGKSDLRKDLNLLLKGE